MNQNKKLILGILLTFVICIGSAILATYSTGPYGNYPNPGIHPGMIGPGTFNDSGVASPQWKFLGDLDVVGILDMNNNKITNISAPTANSDVATKGYVDAAGGSGGGYFVSMNCESKIACGGNIDPWVVPLSNCPIGCAEVHYADGVVGDSSVIGTDYQRFGNIIVYRQKTLYTQNWDWNICSNSLSVIAWDADSGKEFKETGSSRWGQCLGEYGDDSRKNLCAVSCSIRVCSC
ncbi:MAG: hypothetical protein KAT28_05110 [Candidatus Aenigmarchaeota archaeon]|nr:hypothetical protein [Candidatus Aenigmarchaeota archaeon]